MNILKQQTPMKQVTNPNKRPTIRRKHYSTVSWPANVNILRRGLARERKKVTKEGVFQVANIKRSGLHEGLTVFST